MSQPVAVSRHRPRLKILAGHEHLARLLNLGEIVAVTIPSIEQEAARDLVRAREDCRGDLMSARHRLSKLLVRQGIVYSGGKTWTGKHELWLRRQRFVTPGLQEAYDAAFDAMLATVDRRDRLDRAIAAMAADSLFTSVVTRLGCAWYLHAHRVRAGRRDRRLASAHRSVHRGVSGLMPTEYSSGSTRSQGGVTKTGNSHARRLLIEAAWHHRTRYANCGDSGMPPHRQPGPAGRRPTNGYTPDGPTSINARNSPWSPMPRSPANSPAGAGRWPRSTTDTTPQTPG
jgi:transposase